MYLFPYTEQLVCYLEKVAEVASSLPMFYYHIPVMTAVNCKNCYNVHVQLYLYFDLHADLAAHVHLKNVCTYDLITRWLSIFVSNLKPALLTPHHPHPHPHNPVDMEEFLDAASSRLPTLRGLKYTDFDLSTYSRCLTTHGGKYQIMYGRDEVRLMSLCVCSSSDCVRPWLHAFRLRDVVRFIVAIWQIVPLR